MAITQDEAVQMATDCGLAWTFTSEDDYEKSVLLLKDNELTALVNAAYQRGITEANAKVKELEESNKGYEVLFDHAAREKTILEGRVAELEKQVEFWARHAPTDECVKQYEERISELEDRLSLSDGSDRNWESIAKQHEAKIAELQERLEGEAVGTVKLIKPITREAVIEIVWELNGTVNKLNIGDKVFTHPKQVEGEPVAWAIIDKWGQIDGGLVDGRLPPFPPNPETGINNWSPLFTHPSADAKDAERWRFYLANPYRATDKLLATLDINKPALWKSQANVVIDAAIATDAKYDGCAVEIDAKDGGVYVLREIPPDIAVTIEPLSKDVVEPMPYKFLVTGKDGVVSKFDTLDEAISSAADVEADIAAERKVND